MWYVAGTADLPGTQDGVNTRFLLARPLRDDAVVYINGLARLTSDRIQNGYTLTGGYLVLDEAPVPKDVVAIWQPDGNPQGGTTNLGGPTPQGGIAGGLSPTLQTDARTPQGMVWPPPTGTATALTV